MWPFKKSVQEKMSAVTRILFNGLESAIWTAREYDKLAEEGYQKNVIAYRAIDDIAKSGACVPWKLFRRNSEGREEVLEHDVLDLIKKPNPSQGWTFLVYEALSYIQIAGNTYIEAVTSEGQSEPLELWAKRPDKMKIIATELGITAYEFEVNGQKVVWPVDFTTQQADILHLPLFHPLDDLYGLSPIEVAANGVDIHNQFGAWNLALMQNDARPSGVLSTEQHISQPQIEQMKSEAKEKWSGAANAGRPMVLGSGLKWQSMGLSPKDLDWINGKDATARDICHAFGYPPFLLGLPGNSTFNNMESAKLWLWENTIVFYLNYFRDELNTWLMPRYSDGGDLELDYDLSQVPALSSRKSAKIQRANELAPIATINERRAIVGLPPVNGGDIIPMPISTIPLEAISDLDSGAEKAELIKTLVREGYDKSKVVEIVKAAFNGGE